MLIGNYPPNCVSTHTKLDFRTILFEPYNNHSAAFVHYF